MRIVVVGATSDIGQRVVSRLCDLGHAVVATSRAAARLRLIDPRAQTAITSVDDPDTLAPLLASADRIINIAHASTIERLIPLVPPACERLIVIGSTRRYSAVPDRGADAVRHGEEVFLRSNRRGIMLHPTMIYGGHTERNVSRVLHLIERWPRWLPLLWPLPDGGKSLVQPVYVDDLVSAIVAAATGESEMARKIVVAGPRPITLAEMLRQSARHCGRRLMVLPVPAGLLVAAARLLSVTIRFSLFSVAELQRAVEDKAFDISLLRSQLGVEPRPFGDGLRLPAARHAERAEIGRLENSARAEFGNRHDNPAA